MLNIAPIVRDPASPINILYFLLDTPSTLKRKKAINVPSAENDNIADAACPSYIKNNPRMSVAMILNPDAKPSIPSIKFKEFIINTIRRIVNETPAQYGI